MKRKHFAGKARRVRASNCTSCGTAVDAATPIDRKAAKPGPGDVTICLYCGHIMAFADDLSLRDLTDAEMHEVAGNETILDLMRARGMVMGPKQ